MTVAIPITSSSNNTMCCQTIEQNQSFSKNFMNRCWSVLSDGSSLVGRVMSSYDGIDYGSKLFSNIVLAVQVAFQEIGTPIADRLSEKLLGVWAFTGAVSLPGRVKIFTSGEYLKKSVYKNVYNVFMVFKCFLDSTRWLVSQGVLNLGRLATSIGGTRLAQITTAAALGSAARAAFLVAGTFDIVDAMITVSDAAKKHTSMTKPILTIAADVGKIGCTILSPWFFTWYFALLGIYTGAVCLVKSAYDKAHER